MFNFLKRKPKGIQATLKISGMHCASCAMTIDGALEDTAGVFRAETSYAKGEVKIEYDSKKMTAEKLKEIIAAEGYQATELQKGNHAM